MKSSCFLSCAHFVIPTNKLQAEPMGKVTKFPNFTKLQHLGFRRSCFRLKGGQVYWRVTLPASLSKFKDDEDKASLKCCSCFSLSGDISCDNSFNWGELTHTSSFLAFLLCQKVSHGKNLCFNQNKKNKQTKTWLYGCLVIWFFFCCFF